MASTLVLKFDLEEHRDNSDDSFCGLFINFIMKMMQLQKIYKQRCKHKNCIDRTK